MVSVDGFQGIVDGVHNLLLVAVEVLLQKGIHIGQVAYALVIALDVVEQKLQLIHQAHRVLVSGLEGLIEIIGIFAGIFQSGGTRSVDKS